MEEDLHAGADSRAKDGTDTHRDHGTQSGKHSAPGPRMPGRMPKVWGYGLVLGLVGLLVMIGGCSSESHKATRSANTKAASPTTARPASPSGAPPQATNSEPARVDIQAINAHSTLVPLGLDKDGSLATPPLSQVGQAGWYAGGPAPGEKGPAVIVGHVDSRQYGPGVFQNLSKLKPGDPVEVKRKDGSIIVFDVESVKEFPKNNFPTQQVYGNLDYPGLRLITCGGNFDASSGHYVDNIVAFAKQASVRK